jgi:hypothetical protein
MTVIALVLMLVHALGERDAHTRPVELANIAAEIAATDATDDEAAELVTACVHETGCRYGVESRDGRGAKGPWQVEGSRDVSAKEALRRIRWSERVCGGPGHLELFAGCGACGRCPEIVASLLDPSLPRR